MQFLSPGVTSFWEPLNASVETWQIIISISYDIDFGSQK